MRISQNLKRTDIDGKQNKVSFPAMDRQGRASQRRRTRPCSFITGNFKKIFKFTTFFKFIKSVDNIGDYG
jgi:hypothetical protein